MGCKEGEEEEVGRGGGEEGRGGVVEEMAKNATIFACAALRRHLCQPHCSQAAACIFYQEVRMVKVMRTPFLVMMT